MGTIEKEKHDGFVGNVGPVTVTQWKESVVVKGRQQRSDKPRSDKQKAASQRFGILTRFVSVCNAYVSIGFRNTTKGNAQHAAIAANMENGVVGEWPDLRLNYDALRLSEGELPSLKDVSAKCERGTVCITWKKEGGEVVSDDERVNILIYNIEREEAVVELGIAARGDLEAEIIMPKEWCESETDIVGYACVSGGGKVSESVYLGKMEIIGGNKDGVEYGGKVYRAQKSSRKRRKRDEAEIGEEERRHVEGVSGVVGPLIAYDYKGIKCIKSRYRIHKEPTEKKRKANEKFAKLTRFLKAMYEMTKVGFRGESSKMTQLNAALKHNYRNAFRDGEIQLAYERIELSVGGLAGAKITAFRDGDTVEIKWTAGEGGADDKVMVGVYDEEAAEGFVLLEAAKREARSVLVTLPERWGKDERLHVYVAFESRDGETSRSEHVMPT